MVLKVFVDIEEEILLNIIAVIQS